MRRVAITSLLLALALCLQPPVWPGIAGTPTGGARARADDTQSRVAGGRAPDTTSLAEVLSENLTVILHPERSEVSVEAEVVVRANFNLSELRFQLLSTLNVTRLEVSGLAADFSRSGESLVVELPETLLRDRTLALDLSYNGTIWVLESGLRDDCVGPEGAYVKGSTAWYPYHHASDWMDCRLKICCPPNWTAVADGELTEVERGPEWANYTWVTDRPCIRPAFAAANYTSLSTTSGGTNITVYTYPQHAASAPAHLSEASAILSHHEALLGPYERRSLKIVETDHQTFDGYACSGMVMLKPFAFSGGVCDFRLLGHELGHMWFPYKTGYGGWAYPWIWEGFAEYLLCMYEMSHYGTRARLESDREAYASIHDWPNVMAVRSTTWSDPFAFPVLYAKGAYILHMLRGIMGEGPFNRTLREFVEENAYGWASADLFISKASQHSSIPLRDFFDQWLNTTKSLDVALTGARLYEDGEGFYLELEPLNLLRARALTDIGLEYAGGVRETLRLAWDGAAPLVALSTRSSVSRVTLDPDGWLLDVNLSNDAVTVEPSGRIHELEAYSLSVPRRAVEGDVVVVGALALNNGSYDVGGVRVDFLVDGGVELSEKLSLPAGRTAELRFCWSALAGAHVLGVALDAGNELRERSEANNNLSAEVLVAPPPPELDVSVSGIGLSPPSPLEGEWLNVSAVVSNSGGADVANLAVAFELDGTAFTTSAAPPLTPGASAQVRARIAPPRGRHIVAVVADPRNVLREVVEDNNRAELEFLVRWRLGLSVSASPAEPRTLEPVWFCATGEAEELFFDFGDGSATGWGTERAVAHAYSKSGVYDVVLRGRAGGEVEEEVSMSLRVLNQPPQLALFASPPSPLSLMEVGLVVRAIDPDGFVANISWSLGDGSRAWGERVSHIYSRPGAYNISCTVRDEEGAEASEYLLLEVVNRAPEASWEGVRKARAGERVVFRANASDPDGVVVGCRWSFGDGSGAEGQLVEHTYSTPGRYLVTLEVVDDFGGRASATGWVEVTAWDGGADLRTLALALVAAAGLGAVCAVALLYRLKLRRMEREFFRKS
ncbi:MAG: PKD domain-containing protein [Thermoplasmatota archaeon]